MNINPEFRRNLWLELTRYRLAGMPAVLGAVLFLAYLMQEQFHNALTTTPPVLFGIIVMLWGMRLASEAVVSEVRDRTWDGQRMSSIGPWSMTWGKLLGSTVYTWYGGIICLLAYAALTAGDPKVTTMNTIALLASAGLLGQAAALLVSMQAIRKERRYNRSQAAAFFVLGLAVSWIILSIAFSSSSSYVWFGAVFQHRDFVLISILVFLGWSVLGIYRLMRSELQMRNGPFVWLAFTCFIAVYFSGFIGNAEPSDPVNNGFAIAFAVTIILTYVMALSERKDPVAYRRLLASYGRRDWTRVLHELPCWAVTLPPVMVAGCGMFLTAMPNPALVRSAAGYRMFIVASLLFLLRDLGLLLFFNFVKNPKRADMFFVLSIVMLYGVIPGIMEGLRLKSMAALFWPMWNQFSLAGIVSGGVEAILVMSLVVKRWKGLYSS
jgi:hypothetical protein